MCIVRWQFEGDATEFITTAACKASLKNKIGKEKKLKGIGAVVKATRRLKTLGSLLKVPKFL